MAKSNTGDKVATTRSESRRGVTKTQIREERRQRRDSRKRRRRTVYIAGGSVLAVVFILALTLGPGLGSGGGISRSGAALGLNTGGPVALDRNDGAAHVQFDEAHAAYSTLPATSGPHWIGADTPAGVPAPARWGIYDQFIPDEVLIHNLEHGGVGIHYNCPSGCEDLVDDLKGLIGGNPTQFIMSPYANMDSQIAITAWRHHLFLDELDVDQILDFIDAYQDRAPESVPGNLF